jgi:hypothetical protein
MYKYHMSVEDRYSDVEFTENTREAEPVSLPPTNTTKVPERRKILWGD